MGKSDWHRRHVVELLMKLRTSATSRGLRPSAVEMADRLHRHIWKRLQQGDDRATLIVGELLRASLVQMAGQVNRAADPVAWSRDGRSGKVSTPAVARRDADGTPLTIRESPRWAQLTLDDLIEARDRMRSQVEGLNIHLAAMDWTIELLKQHPVGCTVEEACQTDGLDPYALDLDQVLGAI